MSGMIQKLILSLIFFLLISGCVSSFMSVGQVVYDRHNIQYELSNHQLQVKANHALFDTYPHLRKIANVTVTVYNHDLIVTGQVPSKTDKKLVTKLLNDLKGSRSLFNELTIGSNRTLMQALKDSWITSQIRTRMIAANDIDPSAFKILTENGVVYVLGDVKKAQAEIVVDFARETAGVTKVIRVMKYYQYVVNATSKYKV